MDHLDKLVQLAQVHGEVNIHCEFQGDWQLSLDEAENERGIFHLIEEGECFITMAGKQYHLQAGDIFFLPRNRPHQLRQREQSNAPFCVPVVSQNALFAQHRIGQGAAEVKMFCGEFHYHTPSLLMEQLPSCVHLSLKNTPVQPLIQLFLNEATQHQLGSKSAINALANVLFVQILRQMLAHNLLEQSILTAMQNKRLSNVIMHILNAPQESWNIVNLAELANMSRSNFIRVFSEQVGVAPGKFLTQVRLQKAALLLRTTQHTILDIALEVGYLSEANLSRAFKEYYGISPRVYRKA